MTGSKPKHGGRRKGAGAPRKLGAATSLLQVRVSADLLSLIRHEAELGGEVVPEYVRRVLSATVAFACATRDDG